MSDTNLYDWILEILEARESAFVHRFCPPYICAIGSHVFNLQHKQEAILMEHGLVRDYRLNIMFVSWSGFCKSYFSEQFLEGPNSILGSSAIKTKFVGYTTGAGFVGTAREGKNGTVNKQEGMAKRYKDYILGFDEFSAILGGIGQSWNTELDSAVLSALESGRVYKSLAMDEIDYETFCTVYAATQPTRFNMSSGLPRRFFYMQFTPTAADKKIIKDARRAGMNVRDNMDHEAFNKGIDGKIANIRRIKTVTFDFRLYKLFDSLSIPHMIELVYEHLALGYNIMRYPVEERLVVRLDNELERLIRTGHRWRQQLQRGSDISQVLQILRESSGRMNLLQLKMDLLDFGLGWQECSAMLDGMQKTRLIKYDGKDVVLII